MNKDTKVEPGEMIFVRDETDTMIMRVVSDDGDTLTAETTRGEQVIYNLIPKEMCNLFEKRE